MKGNRKIPSTACNALNQLKTESDHKISSNTRLELENILCKKSNFSIKLSCV